MRLLIHPVQDYSLHFQIVGVLNRAVAEKSENYSHVSDTFGIKEHYGYSDHTRACVILSREYGTSYDRLVIRDISDSVHTELRRIIAEWYGLTS